MKRLRDIDRLLAERAVGDEQHLVGLHARAKFLHLLDQIRVDLKAAGGVEDHAVRRGGQRRAEAGGAEGGHILGRAVRVETEFLLLRQDFQLIDGGGAVDVGADDERAIAAFFEELAELGGRGGLARAVEADHQDFQRPHAGEFGRALAEQGDELVVDDFDDLLAGRDALEHILADALGLHARDEVAGDLEMHIGREEGGAHLSEGGRHVFFGEFADATEVTERGGEFIGERLEHGSRHRWGISRREATAGRSVRSVNARWDRLRPLSTA